MRLIDADVFAESLIHCKGLGRTSMEAVLKSLNEQPTAYDVEKVVEQIDEYITKIVGRKSALYQTIMRIVRKGGVE